MFSWKTAADNDLMNFPLQQSPNVENLFPLHCTTINSSFTLREISGLIGCSLEHCNTRLPSNQSESRIGVFCAYLRIMTFIIIWQLLPVFNEAAHSESGGYRGHYKDVKMWSRCQWLLYVDGEIHKSEEEKSNENSLEGLTEFRGLHMHFAAILFIIPLATH